MELNSKNFEIAWEEGHYSIIYRRKYELWISPESRLTSPSFKEAKTEYCGYAREYLARRHFQVFGWNVFYSRPAKLKEIRPVLEKYRQAERKLLLLRAQGQS